MGKITKRNQPCPNSDCGSSDGRQVYEDGGSKCFSCNKSFKLPEDSESGKVVTNNDSDFEEVETIRVKDNTIDHSVEIAEIAGYASRGFKERGITKLVAEFYGVKVSYNSEGEIDTHYYPYDNPDGGGYKVRKLPKKFSYIGKPGGLFGQDKFPAGGKRLIITEGEIDAMSIAQAYQDKHGRIYPVVSVPFGAGNMTHLLEARDWVRAFDEVILCFDNDEAGKAGLEKAIKIVGIDKVKIMKLGERKDPNEVLMKDGGKDLLIHLYNAETFSPAGIMKRGELRKQMHAKANTKSIPYPECLAGIQTKLKGMRFSEIALWISGTGSGKSTLIRENILNIIETTEYKCGVISLEETPGETSRNLSAMAISKNHSNEEIPPEELDVGFDKVFGKDGEEERVIVLDHQGSIKDESIIDQLEYMALMGCKFLFIDHITILVSEGSDGLTGNEAIDKIMNDLLRIAKKHEVHIGLVSHLRKAASGTKSFEDGRLPTLDDIKGSGSIKQVSLDVIAFARNMNAETEIERNTIKMAVLKCRESGLTGSCPGAYYNYATGRMGGAESIPDEQFEIIA